MAEDESAVVVALMNQRLDQFEKKLDKALDDHELRLRRVERWVYALPPTLVLAIASAVLAVIKS